MESIGNYWDFQEHLAEIQRGVYTPGSGSDGSGSGNAARPVAFAAVSVAFSRLEPTDSNLNSSEFEGALIVPCKCRCRTCAKCGPSLGWRVRQNMLTKASLFRDPAMLTLTVDRDHFASPMEAHQRITKGSFIPRLMRLLGVRTWFWVLEFQTASGPGWPHWHLLVDLADVGGRLDLSRAWHLWNDKWGLGGLDLSTKKKANSATHAVNYITKYLTKKPKPAPIWLLGNKQAIRFIGACKRLGSLTGQAPRTENKELHQDEQLNLPFRAPRSLLLVRMAHCGETSNVFAFVGDCQTKQGEWKWLGSVPASPSDLLDLSMQGMVSMRIAPISWGDGELLALTDASIGGVISALRKARTQLADREVGYFDDWSARMEHREQSILQEHVDFWDKRAA